MTTITLPLKIAGELLRQAQEDSQNEICGLVSAKEGVPAGVYPVTNIAKNSTTRYHMDPKQQIDAIKTIRENGETLFAIYHSHPTSPGLPSLTDIQESVYPDVIYLIISLNTIGVLELRAHQINNHSSHELTLEIEKQT